VISARFVPVLCVLVALALVPAVIHSYVGVTDDDGRRASAVPGTLAGFASVPSGRSQTWGKRRFDSDDWMERRYLTPGTETALTIVRSYDLKALYHHPELAVAYGPSYTSYERARVAVRPEMPIHVLRTDDDRGAAAFYALHYDDRFVEHPIRFQLQIAGELLFSPRKPMTLFFVSASGTPAGEDLDGLDATRLLTAAVDSFLAQ